MEFFTVAHATQNESWIQENIDIASMSNFCPSIGVITQNGDSAQIDTIWGEFEVQRQSIRGGVRFALTTCSNALAWTITTGYSPAPEHIVIHCTINRVESNADFVESIEEFVREWKEGLEAQAA